MNKKELDGILKKNPKRCSKYAKYKEEITYLYDNQATLNVISEFLFKKYKLKPTNTTLHYYIKRNILKSKVKRKSVKSLTRDEADNSNSVSNRFTIETSKRQTAK
jgi:hypothetical protein